jgi:pimeloyl-ACP methyl ester carboxylesterase
MPAYDAEVLEARSPDGTPVGCEVVGSGPALLLVHGSVADRERWEPVLAGLAARFRVFLMDRRGRGLSSDEAREYAIEREAEDIAAMVAAIGEPVRILSHSYGATCTLVALESGMAAERVLLYEPPFGTAAGPAFDPAVLAEVEADLGAGDPESALVAFLSKVIRLDARTLEALQGLPSWPARVENARTLAREARCVNAYRPGPALEPAGPTVRLLLGTETPPELVASTRAAHAALPGSELRLLPGHAHAAMEVDPPMFVDEVVAWLAPVGDQPPGAR